MTSKPDSAPKAYTRNYLAFRRKYLTKTRPWRLYNHKVRVYYMKKKKGKIYPFPPSPPPTPSLPPIIEKPDFNGLDEPSIGMTHHFTCPPWEADEVIRIRRFEGSREVEKEIPEYTPRPDEPFSFSMIAVGTFGLCEWSDEKLHADFLYSVFAASMERTIVAGFVRNGRRRSEDHPVSRSTRVRRASFSDRLPRKERDGGKQDLPDQRASQSRHSELAHDALHGDRFRCLAGLYSLYWPILTL